MTEHEAHHGDKDERREQDVDRLNRLIDERVIQRLRNCGIRAGSETGEDQHKEVIAFLFNLKREADIDAAKPNPWRTAVIAVVAAVFSAITSGVITIWRAHNQ